MVSKAVVLFGSSSDLFESSLSSTLRMVESFDIDSIILLYSSFAEEQCRKMEALLTESLSGQSIVIRCEQINEKEYNKHLLNVIDKSTILSPTSGSKFYAFAAMKIGVEQNATIIHTMFPFGPWKGMFYPFVPRFLQPVRIINGEIHPRSEVRDIFNQQFRKKLTDIMEDKFRSSRVTKRVCESSLVINGQDNRNYYENDGNGEWSLDMSQEGNLFLNKDVSDSMLRLKCSPDDNKDNLFYREGDELKSTVENAKFVDLLKKIFVISLGYDADKDSKRGNISFNDIYGILGFGDILVEGENTHDTSLEAISQKTKGIVVDTNLIYSGILMYKGLNMLIPYCTYVEIANKRTELLKNDETSRFKSIYGKFLWESLTELMAHNQVLKTEAFFCDGVIPMIDPILIRDCAILTNDEGAYRHWLDLFSQNVMVLKSKQIFSHNRARIIFAFILLSSMVKELKYNYGENV